MHAYLNGDSVLPARGTERPVAARSSENISSFALVLEERGGEVEQEDENRGESKGERGRGREGGREEGREGGRK